MCPCLSPCVCFPPLPHHVPCIFKFSAKSGTQRDRSVFGMISSCKYATGTKARSAAVITSVPSLDIQHPLPCCTLSLPSNPPAPGLSLHHMKRGPEQSCFVCVCDPVNGMHGNVSHSTVSETDWWCTSTCIFLLHPVSHFLNQQIGKNLIYIEFSSRNEHGTIFLI